MKLENLMLVFAGKLFVGKKLETDSYEKILEGFKIQDETVTFKI